MRLVALVLAVSSSLCVACGASSQGDGGVERAAPSPRTFNVDSSGTAQCPGDLYVAQSYGVAFCDRGPQRCVSAPAGSTGVGLVCTCASADGGRGSWGCGEGR